MSCLLFVTDEGKKFSNALYNELFMNNNIKKVFSGWSEDLVRICQWIETHSNSNLDFAKKENKKIKNARIYYFFAFIDFLIPFIIEKKTAKN